MSISFIFPVRYITTNGLFFFFSTEGQESHNFVKPIHNGLDPVKHLSTGLTLNHIIVLLTSKDC